MKGCGGSSPQPSRTMVSLEQPCPAQHPQPAASSSTRQREQGVAPQKGFWGLVCATTSISSSVHTFLSIFRLRTLVMPGPNPRCSPASEMSHEGPILWWEKSGGPQGSPSVPIWIWVGTCTSLADDNTEVDGGPVRFGGAAVSTEAVGFHCPDPLGHLRVGECLTDGLLHGLHPFLLLLLRVSREAARTDGGEKYNGSGWAAPSAPPPHPGGGCLKILPEDPVWCGEVKAPAIHLLDIPYIHLNVGDANLQPIVLVGESGQGMMGEWMMGSSAWELG